MGALARIPVPPLVWLRSAQIAPPRAMGARSRSTSLVQSRGEELSAGSLAEPFLVMAATAAVAKDRVYTGEPVDMLNFVFCSLGAVQELQIILPGHGPPFFV